MEQETSDNRSYQASITEARTYGLDFENFVFGCKFIKGAIDGLKQEKDM